MWYISEKKTHKKQFSFKRVIWVSLKKNKCLIRRNYFDVKKIDHLKQKCKLKFFRFCKIRRKLLLGNHMKKYTIRDV